MFYIAICDDEEYFRFREKQLIEKYMNSQGYSCKIDIYQSGKELLERRDILEQYEILFLDINMDEIDGIDTAKEIRKITKEAYIVFVTAFVSYALEGYKVDAVRYLLKDDECLEKAVNECLDAIIYKMNYEVHKKSFAFQEGQQTILLDDIMYVESNLHRLVFHMAGEDSARYTMYGRLDELDVDLRENGFCRIHKSFLVNLKYVDTVERYQVTLVNGERLAVSKARFSETKNEYVCYRGEI